MRVFAWGHGSTAGPSQSANALDRESIDNEIRSAYTRMTGPELAQLLMARWCSG